MLITITKAVLKRMLEGFKKIIPRSNHLPILQHICFQVENGQLSAMVTDLEQELIYQAEKGANGIEIEGGDMSFLAPLAELKNLAKGKGHETIGIGPLDENRLNVVTAVNGQDIGRTVETLPVDEFPNSASAGVEVNPYGVISLIDLYRKAVPSASVDATRYVLQSVYLDQKAKAVVATDGRRLAVLDLPDFPFDCSVLLPITKVLDSSLLQQDEGRLGLKKNEADEVQAVVFEVSRWRYTVRCVDGVYPNCQTVIPAKDSDKASITFNPADREVLEQAFQEFPDDDSEHPVIFYADTERVLVLYQDKDSDNPSFPHVALPEAKAAGGGSPVVFMVNRRYFQTALEAGFNTVQVTGEATPLRFTGESAGVYVLMPLHSRNALMAELSGYLRENVDSTITILPKEPEENMDKEPKEEAGEGQADKQPAKQPVKRQAKPKVIEPDQPVTELLTAIDQAYAVVREAADAIRQLKQKVREIERRQKTRQKEFRAAHELIGKLKKVANF